MQSINQKQLTEEKITWNIEELISLMKESDNFEVYYTHGLTIQSLKNSVILKILQINSIKSLRRSGLVNEIISLEKQDSIDEKFDILGITDLASFQKKLSNQRDFYEEIVWGHFLSQFTLDESDLFGNNSNKEDISNIFYITLSYLSEKDTISIRNLCSNQYFTIFLKTASSNIVHSVLRQYNIHSIHDFIEILDLGAFSDFMFSSKDTKENKKLFFEFYQTEGHKSLLQYAKTNTNVKYLLKNAQNDNLSSLFNKYNTYLELNDLFTKKSFNLLKRSAAKDNNRNFIKILQKQFENSNQNRELNSLNLTFGTKLGLGACKDSEIHNLNILSGLQKEQPVFILNKHKVIGYIKIGNLLNQDGRNKTGDPTLMVLKDVYENGELLLSKGGIYYIEDVDEHIKKKKIELTTLEESLNINYLRTLDINNDFYDNYLNGLQG